MWLTNFKIALVEKNIDKLSILMKNVPPLNNNKEREEALYLIKQAADFISSLKENTSNSMKQIQKNLNFLKSVEHKTSTRLDIKL